MAACLPALPRWKHVAACLGTLSLAFGYAVHAEDSVERVPADWAPAPIEVPDGFQVELVAGPPLVKYPMMAALDDRGRLFIAESDGQNLGKEALLEQQPRFVRMLEDTDSDGRFDKSTIFADRMVMPEGALCLHGSLYIMSAPYLWRLEDTDGDGVADERQQIVGEMDLIGNANQHGPYLSPAGRLHFSGGTFGYNLVGREGGAPIKGNWASVFSCQLDGSDLRVESHAGINPVEVEFTPEGEMLGTCAIFDRVGGRCDALVHWVHGGSYAERLREPVLKPTGRYLPAALRWGQVAPAGLVRMRGSHFGDDYQGNLFACWFNTHEVVRIRIERLGATYRGEHEVFLHSPSTDFHPADILEDADGSLLLIDTGAWLTMGCPSSKNGHPGGYGAIYRIRKTNGAVVADPRGAELSWDSPSAELVPRLADPRPAVVDRAMAALVTRGDKAVPALAAALRKGNEIQLRRNAVWTLARIGTDSARAALVEALLDSNPSVRQAAVHAAGILREPRASDQLMEFVVDDELPIRREAATALGLIRAARSVPALFESLRTATDEFLEHALIFALLEIGDHSAIRAGLADTHPRVQRAALISLNQLDAASLTREDVAPMLSSGDHELQQAALEILGEHPTWAGEIVELLRSRLAANPPTLQDKAIIAGAVPAFAANDDVQSLVANVLASPDTPAETLLTVIESMDRMTMPELPATWVPHINRLLLSGNDDVQRVLLASLARLEVDALHTALRSLARDDALSSDIRLAALALVSRSNGELEDRDLTFLIKHISADSLPVDRLRALGAIASARLSLRQLESLLPLVHTSGPLELPSLLQAFEVAAREGRVTDNAASEVGSQLVVALENSPGRVALPSARIHAVLAAFPEAVRTASAERFPHAATGDAEMRARIARIESKVAQGSADAGKQLFFSNRLACSGCHRISSQGGTVGPDLSQIARIRAPEQLAEAILLPSATLANGFESYTVVTVAGRVISGLVRRETAADIYMVAADGTEHRIARADVDSINPSLVSIMPQGLEHQLSDEQLRDLVAYLGTLQ